MKTQLSVFLICGAAFFLGPSAYGDVNVLVNPGFEEGTAGWASRNCTFSVVTGGRTGAYRGYATGRTAAWQGIKQSILGKVNIGQTVTISGWVRLDNASSDTIKLTVEQQDGNETNYTQIQQRTGYSNQWTQLSGEFTLEVTGTLTVLDIYFEGPASGVNFYVDDAAVVVPETQGNDAAATINPAVRYQTIDGFGGAGAWYEGWLTAHPQRNQLYNILFRDLGLDIYRLRNTYDQGTEGAAYMNNSAQIVAGAEAALGRPLKILISSWSPPTYLKSNDELSRGTLKSSGGQYMYAQFGQWWSDSVQVWATTYGITADYISIQNEPDWAADWDTCRFDPTQNSTNAGYNQAFDAVYAALNSRFGSGMPKMVAPETTGFYGAAGFSLHQYLNAINDHSKVYGYAHHLYNINAGDDPDAYLTAMATFQNNWGSKPLFQTEYEKATDFWPDALNMALLLHNSLAVEQVSAYIYWDLFWGNGGLVTLDNPWQGTPGYTINSDYYGFKHYSAFIHSDWQRIDAVADVTTLRISAFISPDNQQLTAVVINPSETTAYDLDLSFSDITLESGQVYRTTASQNCVLLGGFNPDEALTLPAQSITTLALQLEAGPESPTTCAEVQAMGYGLAGDLDGNCTVNLSDVVRLAAFWLNGAPEYDLGDFAAVSEQWLMCNDPQDDSCVQNW